MPRARRSRRASMSWPSACCRCRSPPWVCVTTRAWAGARGPWRWRQSVCRRWPSVHATTASAPTRAPSTPPPIGAPRSPRSPTKSCSGPHADDIRKLQARSAAAPEVEADARRNPHPAQLRDGRLRRGRPRGSVVARSAGERGRRPRVSEGQYCPDLVMSRRCEAVGRDRLLIAVCRDCVCSPKAQIGDKASAVNDRSRAGPRSRSGLIHGLLAGAVRLVWLPHSIAEERDGAGK